MRTSFKSITCCVSARSNVAVRSSTPRWTSRHVPALETNRAGLVLNARAAEPWARLCHRRGTASKQKAARQIPQKAVSRRPIVHRNSRKEAQRKETGVKGLRGQNANGWFVLLAGYLLQGT